jgi:hypothetical protein
MIRRYPAPPDFWIDTSATLDRVDRSRARDYSPGEGEVRRWAGRQILIVLILFMLGSAVVYAIHIAGRRTATGHATPAALAPARHKVAPEPYRQQKPVSRVNSAAQQMPAASVPGLDSDIHGLGRFPTAQRH